MPVKPFITVNKVVFGITRTLANSFPEANIYVEEVPQEIQPPAFFVKLIQVEQTQDLGPRHWRYHPFDIHYFSPNKSNVEMQEVAEQLYDLLRWIEIEGKTYKGTNLNHQIVDRVLHFFVDYNFIVRHLEPEIPSMKELDIEEGLKSV